jgi:cell division protein FtsB
MKNEMFEKIKNLQNSKAFKSLQDVRMLGMIAFGVIALLVTWSSVKVVETNYDLQKQISAMQQQNDVQQLTNNNLKLQNQYYNTNEYLELAARRHFNKAAPGETLVVVPKSVAMAHTIDIPVAKTQDQTLNEAVEASGSSFQRNFNAWLDFLFHREAIN